MVGRKLWILRKDKRQICKRDNMVGFDGCKQKYTAGKGHAWTR